MSRRFVIETHAHTAEVSPCGWLTPKALVTGYLEAGYSGLAVTDHLTATLPILDGTETWCDRVHRFFSGYRETSRAAAGTGLAVYPGFELTFTEFPGNDFLVYGIDETTLLEIPDPYHLAPETFKGLANRHGGVVFQAHPFRNGGPLGTNLVDGIEVCNCNPRHDSENHRALAFAREHGLLSIGGSDAHREEDIARGGISLPELPRSGTELARWLRESPDEIEVLSVCEARES